MVDESLTPVEVLPGVWRVGAEMSSTPYRIMTNAYLVEGGEQSLMIDTAWWSGVPTAHIDALLRVATERGRPLAGVFITHAHRDHSGFAEYVVGHAAEAVPVYLHADERPAVAAMSNYQGLPDRDTAVDWYRGFGFSREMATAIVETKHPDNPLTVPGLAWCASGDVIAVGDRRLRVLPTPGHTPGHAALYDEERGILFSGDALLPRGHGNPHVTVRPFTSPDPLTDYVNGLAALRELDIRVCLPGHGPAVEDARALIDAHLAYAASKLDPLRDALGREPLTAYEVAGAIPWRSGRKRFTELVNDEWFLAFGDTLARLRRAVTLGLAIQEMRDDGVPLFRAAGGQERVT